MNTCMETLTLNGVQFTRTHDGGLCVSAEQSWADHFYDFGRGKIDLWKLKMEFDAEQVRELCDWLCA